MTETRTADEPLSGPTPGPAPDPAGASAAPERPAPRGPDAPAVALGLAALTAAVLVALVELTGVRVDVGLVVPLGLLALGALLVAGGVVTGLARRDRHPR